MCISNIPKTMTPIINTGKTRSVFVEVPGRADNDSIEITKWNTLYFYTGVSPDHEGHEIKLPPGSWQILGKSNELTEEQKRLLFGYDQGYYTCKNPFIYEFHVNAAFEALKQAIGIVDDRTYLVLIQS